MSWKTRSPLLQMRTMTWMRIVLNQQTTQKLKLKKQQTGSGMHGCKTFRQAVKRASRSKELLRRKSDVCGYTQSVFSLAWQHSIGETAFVLGLGGHLRRLHD